MTADTPRIRTADEAIAVLRDPDAPREHLVAAGVVLADQYEVLHQALVEERQRKRRLQGGPTPYPHHLDKPPAGET